MRYRSVVICKDLDKLHEFAGELDNKYKFYVKFADRGKANTGLYSNIWRLQIESTPVTSRSNSTLEFD